MIPQTVPLYNSISINRVFCSLYMGMLWLELLTGDKHSCEEIRGRRVDKDGKIGKKFVSSWNLTHFEIFLSMHKIIPNAQRQTSFDIILVESYKMPQYIYESKTYIDIYRHWSVVTHKVNALVSIDSWEKSFQLQISRPV